MGARRVGGLGEGARKAVAVLGDLFFFLPFFLNSFFMQNKTRSFSEYFLPTKNVGFSWHLFFCTMSGSTIGVDRVYFSEEASLGK